MKNALLLLGILCSSTVLARGAGWEPNSFDLYGYVPISDIPMENSTASLFKSIAKNPLEAKKQFEKLFDKDSENLVYIYGMLIAGRVSKRPYDGLERIALRYQAVREKQLNKGISRDEIPLNYKIGFDVGLSMLEANENEDGGQSKSSDGLQKASKFFRGTFQDARPSIKKLSKLQAVLYGSALYKGGDISYSRTVFKQFSDENPHYIPCHFILCRLYQAGIVAYADSKGRPLPISDGEKARPDLARREIMIVYKSWPKSPAANYYVGMLFKKIDVALTKKCWTYFMSTETGKNASASSRKMIEDWLKSH